MSIAGEILASGVNVSAHPSRCSSGTVGSPARSGLRCVAESFLLGGEYVKALSVKSHRRNKGTLRLLSRMHRTRGLRPTLFTRPCLRFSCPR